MFCGVVGALSPIAGGYLFLPCLPAAFPGASGKLPRFILAPALVGETNALTLSA